MVKWCRISNIDQWNFVNNAEQTYTTTFASPGWIPFRIEYRETVGAASLNFNWSGPGFAKRAIYGEYLSANLIAAYGDYGLDDSFAIQPGSPAIDAGDPNDLYVYEPMPNGGRVNVGRSSNTRLAEVSPLQSLQVLSPNGLEKFELGQTVPINVRSNGLLPAQPTLLLNGGNQAVEAWSAGSTFQTAVWLAQPITSSMEPRSTARLLPAHHRTRCIAATWAVILA